MIEDGSQSRSRSVSVPFIHGRARTDSDVDRRHLSPRSPRHVRSQSVRATSSKRAAKDDAYPEGFRPRVATMPSDGGWRARRRWQHERDRSHSSRLSLYGDDEDDDIYLLRHFSVTSRGDVINKGDLYRQRSRSNTSVTSTASSVTEGTSGSSGVGGRRPCAVIMLGAVGVGKTALVSQFMTSEYLNTYDISQEEELEKTVSVLLDGEECELTFIDHPTRSDLNLLPQDGRSDDAYVVVYSVTDRSSLERAVDILFRLREMGRTLNRSVILVGNKSDLVRSREVAKEEGKTIACTYECKFTETSAGICHNVDELLAGIVKQIRLKTKQEAERKEFVSPPWPTGRTKGSLKCERRARTFLSKLIGKNEYKSKSCDNLQVL